MHIKINMLIHLDTIENTNTTYYDIENLFDYAVANIVEELTIDEEKRKEVGKEKYYEPINIPIVQKEKVYKQRQFGLYAHYKGQVLF